MACECRFHPEALYEIAASTHYYLQEASARVAKSFISAVESAVDALKGDPTRWRIVADPEIRRYVLGSFPYVIYYRWDQMRGCITIYAVMHCSREPDYWRDRLE